MEEAAKGIDYLNGINIQHRDIKPQNLLHMGGGIKVADFGLARILQHTLTHTDNISCTVAYGCSGTFQPRGEPVLRSIRSGDQLLPTSRRSFSV